MQLIDPNTLLGHTLHALRLWPIQIIPAETIDRHKHEGIGQRRGDTEQKEAEGQKAFHYRVTPLREVFMSLWHAPVSRCSLKTRFAVIDTT